MNANKITVLTERIAGNKRQRAYIKRPGVYQSPQNIVDVGRLTRQIEEDELELGRLQFKGNA